MIPKIIHYCWFGKNPKSKLILKCIDSWKKYCPDWEMIEWNEDNFDVNQNEFCRQAYQNKKWAFVSDFARFDILYKYGGIYLDTDVEILRPLDCFLKNKLFAGHETDEWIAPGLILGSEDGHPVIEEVLRAYQNSSFLDELGNEIHTTVGQYFTNALLKNGVILTGKTQIVDGIAIYSKDFFCPLNDATGIITKTENTHTIHWYSKTWINPGIRIRTKITRIFHRIFGNECFLWLKR